MRAPCWTNFLTGEYGTQRQTLSENALGIWLLLSLTNTQQVMNGYPQYPATLLT